MNSEHFYGKPMSFGGAIYEKSISSIFGGTLHLQDLVISSYDREHYKGNYTFSASCSIEELYNIKVSNFMPEDEDIRCLYCDKYEDGVPIIYFCKITNFCVVRRGNDIGIRIWGAIAEKDYGHNRDRYFNDSEMRVLQAEYLGRKIMPEMITVNGRFELMDLD